MDQSPAASTPAAAVAGRCRFYNIPPMLNITLGTAGHIDHGKTALVKLLTGCETDRLKEEKERGMSIDLGYAPCRIADLEVGIVDVPGHENFIKTMVAGACGMDGVMLVVAADDGIMPQTREHLDILTLLGVRHGLVALTKIDRVDDRRRQQVIADLGHFLKGTFLADAPVLPVSNVTGEGFEQLYAALEQMVRTIPPRAIDGVFRLPLDRAFSAKGFGTVIAGIPVAGAAAVGDEVVLLPQQAAGRIRRIEVYGSPSDTVLAGQCAALNIGHFDARNISRGDVLTLPGYFSSAEFYLCRLTLLPPGNEKIALKNGTALKFHTGTAEVAATLYLLEPDELQGNGEHLVQLRTRRPIVAGPNDPFILRTLSPVRTIGGGRVVEAISRRLKHNRPGVLEDLQRRAAAVADPARWVEYAVRTAPETAADAVELAQRTKIPRSRLDEILAELTRRRTVLAIGGGLYLHQAAAEETGAKLLDILAQYHRRSPESQGMTAEQLRQECSFSRPVWEAVMELLKGDGRLVDREGRLALAGHKPVVPDRDAAAMEAVESLFRQRLFNPPSMAEAAAQTTLSEKELERLIRILQERRRLAAVGEGLVFHREAVDRAERLLVEHIQKEGRLESVDFKYLVDTTRKYALPLLDYFDRTGLLRRVGNTRYLKTTTGQRTD